MKLMFLAMRNAWLEVIEFRITGVNILPNRTWSPDGEWSEKERINASASTHYPTRSITRSVSSFWGSSSRMMIRSCNFSHLHWNKSFYIWFNHWTSHEISAFWWKQDKISGSNDRMSPSRTKSQVVEACHDNRKDCSSSIRDATRSLSDATDSVLTLFEF